MLSNPLISIESELLLSDLEAVESSLVLTCIRPFSGYHQNHLNLTGFPISGH